MSYARILPVWLLLVVATWGCSRTPPSPGTLSANANPQARVAALEDEIKQIRAARDAASTQADGLRAKLKDAEAKLAAEVGRGAAIERERDAARADAKSRAAERDALAAQYDGFRKALKDMLGSAEAALAPAPSAVATEELPMPRPGF